LHREDRAAGGKGRQGQEQRENRSENAVPAEAPAGGGGKRPGKQVRNVHGAVVLRITIKIKNGVGNLQSALGFCRNRHGPHAPAGERRGTSRVLAGVHGRIVWQVMLYFYDASASFKCSRKMAFFSIKTG
jgi:hypothetical protein